MSDMSNSSPRPAVPGDRRPSVAVNIGKIKVGGGAPIVVQSMTNTDTEDPVSTAKQIAELARAGSELVRITVNTPAAAAAVPRIRERLEMMGVDVPIIGDFHYNGHQLLEAEPACAEALSKYRINPGNVGFGKKKDSQFAAIIEMAIRYDKPVRIGANWGSLDQSMVATLMDENAHRAEPWDASHVAREALIRSAVDSAARAESIGLSRDRIILSCKVSGVQELIAVYRDLAARCDYALHLGLTEAGHGLKRHHRVQRGARRADAVGYRRHHPHFVDARTGCIANGRGHRRARTVADDGIALVYAVGYRVSRLRSHDQRVFPGTGANGAGACASKNARMAR